MTFGYVVDIYILINCEYPPIADITSICFKIGSSEISREVMV